MASEFNASGFNFFNDTFKNINKKKTEFNDEMSNNFYVNDANEFIELSDMAISDSRNNAQANENINIFSFQEEAYDSSDYMFEDEGGSFFDDMG